MCQKKKTVNILLATYNGEKYIKEQIESLLNQTYPYIKIYINDDCSNDRTIDIIKDIHSKKIVHISSIKCGSARKNFQLLINIAYKKDINDYYMFCDQDDIWLPEKVKTEVEMMELLEKEHGRNSLLEIYSNYYIFNNNVTEKNIAYKTKPISNFEHLVIQSWVMGCTMLVNSQLIKYGKKIPEEAENHDKWLSIVASLYGNICYISEPLMLHRIHTGNVTTQENTTSFKNRLNRILTRFKRDELKNFRDKHIHLFEDLSSFNDLEPNNRKLEQYKNVALNHGIRSLMFYKKYCYHGVDNLQTFMFGLQFLLS